MESFWKNKKVLITGNTGFKGSWLSIWLKELGAEVFGYSLSPETKPNMYSACGLEKEINSMINDISNFESLKKYIKKIKPEIIYHMAAQPLVIESYINPYNTLVTNVQGTFNILECLRNLNYSHTFINVTTDKVYENNDSDISYKEEDKLGGNDIYSVSKACSDLVTKSYRKSFYDKCNKNINISTARSGNVIGGGDWSENRLIPDIVRAVANNESLEIRNPDATRPWQHVLEPLYGYILLAESMHSNNEFSSAWNFGPNDNQEKTVEEVAASLLKMYKRQDLYRRSPSKSKYKESKLLKLNCEKSERKLSWRSILTINECLELTYSWYSAFYNSENVYTLTKNQIKSYIDKVNESNKNKI